LKKSLVIFKRDVLALYSDKKIESYLIHDSVV